VFDALFAVEMRGIPADENGYRRLEQEVIKNVERLYDRCIDLAQEGDEERYRKALKNDQAKLEDFNPQSSQQVLAALYAREADMRYMSVEDGKVSATRRTWRPSMTSLPRRSWSSAPRRRFTPLTSSRCSSALCAGTKAVEGASSSLLTAASTRLTVSLARSPGACPALTRTCRTSRETTFACATTSRPSPEGYKLVTCDLSNIEMRLFAAYAGPGKMLDLMRSDDADVHSYTAKALGITDPKRAGGWVESARQRAKVFNFSVIYGGGFRTIRRQQRVDMAEARRLKQRYYDTFPEVALLQDRIEQTLASRGYIRPSTAAAFPAPPRGVQVRQLPRPGHGGRDPQGGSRVLPRGGHPRRRSDSRRDHRSRARG
jgi:hypothetical protein